MVGNKCLCWAIVEFERQFYGNMSEERLEGTVTLKMTEIEREMAVVVVALHPRVTQTDFISDQQWEECEKVLREAYMAYYCNCKQFQHDMAAQSNRNNPVATHSPVLFPGKRSIKRRKFMQIPTAKKTPVPLIAPHDEKEKAEEEFDKVHEAYVNYLDKSNMVHLPWRELYPDLPKGAQDPRKHLQILYMKTLMEHLMKQNAKMDNCFGYLPLMCGFSPVQLGTLVAQSFAKRMNSAGNLLVTKH